MKTANEEIISIKGTLSGVKKQIRDLTSSVYKIEKKLDQLVWYIIIGLGSLSLTLFGGLLLLLAK